MNPMLYLLLLLSLILCCVAASQNAAMAQANPPVTAAPPAPPPLPASPVDTFRKILAMPEAEREKFLATLSPEKRDVVRLKLDEYQGLPAEHREARLRALQVRVHVRHLIKLPATNRVDRLSLLPLVERQLVEARLMDWDQLPPNLQKEVLTNEIAIRHIASLPDFKFDRALPPFPPDAKVAKELAHWNTRSEGERADILRVYESFFEEFSPDKRGKILAERPEVEKRVAPIVSMSKEQRDRYIAGLKRFNALTPAQRQVFLNNAATWEKMTPAQRDSWRVLARKLTPTLPPPPPVPGRNGASLVPEADRAAVDLPAR